MKLQLPTQFYKFLTVVLLLSVTCFGQINYTEDFEGAADGWLDGDFEVTDVATCNGAGSLQANAFEIFGFVIPAEVISGSIGTSDGSQLTLSYSYKLLQYDSDEPTEPTPNSPAWGNFTLEYATAPDGPWTLLQTVSPSNHVESATCAVKTVTFTPPAGQEVYLRFNATPATGADYFIYLDDISAAPSPGCTGTPAAANAVAEDTDICTNQQAVLSLDTQYDEAGITYQWQTSTDGVDYTDVAAGGDMATYTATQTGTTWYRAIITCENSSLFVESTPVQVTVNGQLCYCDVAFEFGVEPITLVNIGSINNVTSAELDGTPALEDFTALPVSDFAKGATYPVALEGNTGGNFVNYFKVFIDFNQNGSLDDEGESFEIGTITNSDGEDGVQAQGNITIPEDALTGNTRMRVIKLYFLSPETACTGEDFGYGQAEDYTVNIVEPTACSVAPEAAATLATEDTICLNESTTLSLDTNYVEEGITFQWQSSADGVDFEDIAGAESQQYTATQSQTTWYRALVTCENGNLSTPSEPIQIVSTGVLCYCDVEFEDGVEPITYVEFVSLVNQSADDDDENNMEDFTGLDAPVVQQGNTYTITLGGNTVGNFENFFTVFFDWNQNGVLDDTGEVYEIGSITNSTGTDGIYATSDITVPADAELGSTRMRVIKHYNESPVDPCGEEGYSYGQVEDYDVTVDVPASVTSFGNTAFSYYPNPVKDVLNLSHTSVISSVQVFNLLGQQVMNLKTDSNEVQADMASLPQGTYLVKVTAGNAVQSIKVIRQ